MNVVLLIRKQLWYSQNGYLLMPSNLRLGAL
jgi:hypothetical protein